MTATGHEGLSAGATRRTSRASAPSPTSSPRSSAGGSTRSAAAAARRRDAGRRRRRRGRDRPRDAARGTQAEVAFERSTPASTASGNGAEPGTPIETCERCDGAGQLQPVSRTALRPARAHRRSATSAAATAGCPSSRARTAMARARAPERAPRGRRPRRHLRRPAHPPHRPRPRRRARRAGRRPLRARPGRARTSASCATASDLVTVVDVPAPLAALGTTVDVPTLDGGDRSRSPRGRSPARPSTLRGRGHAAAAAAAATATCASSSTSSSRASSPASSATCSRGSRSRIDRREPAPRTRACSRSSGACSPDERAFLIRIGFRVRRAERRDRAGGAAGLLRPPGAARACSTASDVEYAVYGAARPRCPTCPTCARRRATRWSRSRARRLPTTGRRRWNDFHSRSHRRVALPPWAEPSRDPDVIDLAIASGYAFGTGMHPTTRLCLELLLTLEPGGALCDWGAGTGVLAMAAARLGWDPVTAIELDLLLARDDPGQRARQRRCGDDEVGLTCGNRPAVGADGDRQPPDLVLLVSVRRHPRAPARADDRLRVAGAHDRRGTRGLRAPRPARADRRVRLGWAALVLEPGDPPRRPRGAAQTEAVLAELLELAPAGVEERDLRGGTTSTRSTARPASCRRCPRSRPPPATCSSTCRRTRDRRRLGRALEGSGTGRSTSAAFRLRSPPWEPPRAGDGSTSSSTPARPSAPARTRRRACASSCC